MTEVQPGILALLAVTLGLGLMAFVVVTTTAFMKISIVLFLVRNALGAQQVPPNIVLYGAALILTVYISSPVAEQVFQRAADPQLTYRTLDDYMTAGKSIQEPIRDHLSRFTSPEQRQFFLDATQRVWPEGARSSAGPDDLQILVPSFMISELKRAFEIGFLLYLPFIVIDLVVTTILMAMGMSMVSPTVISIPFKLFLFIAIDGWSRLMHGLVLSYAVPG
ncbi:type III secretion system export apparatus subunit SctR [Methylobacterium brachythecii]|uniref:EscR/YscR/HrcR family type III secretion system export apparatus protein n=1 Tax=Methylobacterium brachythecii TaxID=1176177 RepID=A0A7W6AHA0_9HYPH|nr:type III secretion system export apparatus subunit SctR [Methylobacterium brachythecii]MBB3903297.1 type III secretion protein R [Methylobacterium brachythecii]GLS46085.1 EscR/YscR/HrcR family type III secretion system export apparatus protein [Methylobacterium brachythecii]